MKKSLLLFVVIVLSFGSLFAQDELMEKAKSGGFYAGANIGLPISTGSEVSSFNFGFDVAYLFEVIDNLEVGGLLGYTHFVGGDDKYFDVGSGSNVTFDYKDAAFLPIAATARYYFADHKFFGGIDLGIAINVAGDAKTGFYARPKFGYDLGTIALIASFQNISGGSDYGNNGNDTYYASYSGFNSFNVGVEFGF
jgi:hypothetical protein